MPLILNKRVWVLAERLYIHANGQDEFIELLQTNDIDFSDNNYDELLKYTKPYYTFMSEENYEFADFMELVSSYKYLPLLEKIKFDKNVLKTLSDNWNYFGENVKNWYPDFLGLLHLSGVKSDFKNQTLFYEESQEEEPASGDFVSLQFGDVFIDYIRKELNESYASGLMLSAMFLARKILEVVCVRVLEVVFPKLVNKEYNEENHEIWYDKRHGKYHNFEVLLDNLKDNSGSFHEDRELIKEFVSLVKPFKNETNACVHKDYKMPDESYTKQWKIPYILSFAGRLFKKYCNP